MPVTIFTNPIQENQTGEYNFELVNENGDGVDSVELQSLTITYYDKITGQIINNRLNQNALGVNNVSILTTSLPTLTTTVTWFLRPEDTVIIDNRHELEWHVVLFQWTWGGMTVLHSAHEMEFQIENLTYVP